MPGCWVREDGDMEWVSPDPGVPELYISDNEVVATLLGPKGEVLSQLREREPIGYRQGRY